MENKYFVFVVMTLLLVAPVMAKGLNLEEVENLLDKPSLETLEPKQVELTDRLDKSYIVKEGGVYFKELKQTDPVVWIDKKVGDVYHVDSKRDFIKNETVTLEFYYEVQPDWIAHYAHSGEFDRYYFPTQWDWTPNCVSEDKCNGGWVTFEVYNVEKGTGSSTFPIGTTGPTWARQSQGYGEFDGEGSNVNLEGINLTENNFTIVFWAYPTGSGEREVLVDQGGTLNQFGIRSAGYWSFYNGSWEVTNANAINDEWQFLTYEYKNSTGNITLYFNGVLNRTFTRRPAPEFIISLISVNSNTFNGSIDEVLIYNRSLSQAEITALYNNYSVTSTGINRTGTPSTDGLVLDINFDDYSVADNSGSGNHGTNTNVSFGIVENVLRTLTPTTDYTLGATTGLFTIVNTDYSWSWLNVSWSYLDELKEAQDYAVSLDAMESLGELGSWFSSIIIISIAGGILFLIYFAFGKPKNESSFNY